MSDWNDLHSGDGLIQAVVHLLDGDPDVRREAYNFVRTTPLMARSLSEAQRATLFSSVMTVLNQPQAWQDIWGVCVFLSSIVLRFCDPRIGAKLMVHAFDQTDDLIRRNQLLYNLRVACFSKNIDVGCTLWDLFFRHYDDWFAAYPGPEPVFTPRRDRAVILLSQFLAPPHAPTVDALAKYDILHERFGYDVVLINTNENPGEADIMLAEKFTSNRNRALHGFQAVGPSQANIFTPPQAMPSYEGFAAVFDFVAKWQPAFILNYGAFNFSAEYLGRFAKVITMPAGTELLPTRTAQYDVSFRPLTDGDAAMIARYGMQSVKVIETLYNYDLPAAKTEPRRTDFALSDDAFVVCVVGTRLSDEIDDANIELIRAVLAVDPRIVVVFVGKVLPSVVEDLKARLPVERLRFAGFVADVPGFYKTIADLYVNPRRGGGGSSAAFALGYGVPALTLRHGHVGDLTHPDFVFESVARLCDAVRSAATDPAEHAAMRQKALAGFERIGSRERMVRTILDAAGLPTDVKSAG